MISALTSLLAAGAIQVAELRAPTFPKGEVLEWTRSETDPATPTDDEFERLTYRISGKLRSDNHFELRVLLDEHIFDGLKLDLPKDQKPTILEWPVLYLAASSGQFKGWESTMLRQWVLSTYCPPKRAVRVGEKWQVTTTFSESSDVPNSTHIFKFERVEGPNFVVSHLATELEANQPASSRGEIRLSSNTMRVISATWNLKNVPVIGIPEKRTSVSIMQTVR